MTTNKFGYFHYNTHCDKNYDQEFVILTKEKKIKVATIDGDGKTTLSFEHPKKIGNEKRNSDVPPRYHVSERSTFLSTSYK